MAISNRSVLCVYRYDPLDRLADCSPAGQGSTRFFYQKHLLATQIQGQIQHTLLRTDEHLLAHLSVENNASDCLLLATDQQQSVITAQGFAFVYTPYGHRHPSAGPMNLPGYTGQRRDPATGHYLLGNGYRAFNPVLMRFNSPDSLSPFGAGGLNAYGYGGGDPVNKIDPSGHMPGLLKSLLRGVGLMRTAVPRTQRSDRTMKFIELTNKRTLARDVNIYDRVKNGRRSELVVDAHGYDPSIHGGPRVLMGRQPVSPTILDFTLRQQGVKYDNYESVRLFVCYSGVGSANSFATEFSRLSDLPVKAYRGKIVGYGPYEIRRNINRTYESVFRLGIHKKNIFEAGSKLDKDFSYDPVWRTAL